MSIRRRHQKKSPLTLVLMLVLIIVIGALLIFWNPAEVKAQERPTPEQATLVKDGEAAPNFTVNMFDGSTVKLSDLKGKVVLLNFWATWCPPCRAELARVQKDIIDRFKGEPFVFLPVSRGDSKEKVAEFRKKMGYTFPMGLDCDSTVYRKYAQTYIPRNFLIDKRGRIVKASVGYKAEEFDELIKLIEKTIKK